MELARYFVSQDQHEWLVCFEGARLGAFGSAQDALRAARAWAAFWTQAGHDADVYFQSGSGMLQHISLETTAH